MNLVTVLLIAALIAGSQFTPPFTKALQYGDFGAQVAILQHLLNRFNLVHKESAIPITRNFDATTNQAAKRFVDFSQCQTTSSHVLGAQCLDKLLSDYMCDGYTDGDSNFIPEGLKYRINVPVFSNRSIDIIARMYGLGEGKANGTCANPVPGGCDGVLLHTFKVGTHGQDDSSTGKALNGWASDGWTPTGLMTLDWDGPEPDPKSFGPYPVNRAIWGFEKPIDSKGHMPTVPNAAAIIGTYDLMKQGKTHPLRWGILIHTGEWPGWNPSKPFPYSHGCIHSAPNDIKTIWQLGLEQGVSVRYPNPGGVWPYMYPGQGILSVYQVDACQWTLGLKD